MQNCNRDTANVRAHLWCVILISAVVLLAVLITGCARPTNEATSSENASEEVSQEVSQDTGRIVNQDVSRNAAPKFTIDDIPKYDGAFSVDVNGGIPFFSEADYALAFDLEPFEHYSGLDSLGRCGPAFALIGSETMPTAPRESIGMIEPSGWQIARYDWIDGEYLFNRCHLIAYALSAENDNPLNLITGTRAMNVQGMLPYEERTAVYIDHTGNHVLYRVTPFFEGDNLVASGVLMEAESIEDKGAGITFCVWCYNVEPGVTIDYSKGDNWANGASAEEINSSAGGNASEESFSAQAVAIGTGVSQQSSKASSAQSDNAAVHTYILNTRSKRFHWPDCHSVTQMKDKNKQEFTGTRDEAIAMGYKPCGECHP